MKFFAQMVLSLQHVHSKQILHRDLKTQNILLDKKKEIVKIGDFGISKVLSSKSKAYTAKIVEALLGYEVVQVSCGASHVLAVTNEHEVLSWGRGDNGRLGLGNQECMTSPQPVSVPEEVRPCSVYCGVDCSVILTLGGTLFCCGNNRNNKLGLDEISSHGALERLVEEVHTFAPITSAPVSHLHVQGVAVGMSHTAILTVEGKCYTFGSNQFGQLGYEKEQQDRRPALVKALALQKLMVVACRDTFTVAAADGGEIYSWGKNARGRLGRVDEDSGVPKKVTVTGEDPFTVVSLSCSHGNTLLAISPIQRAGSPVDV